MSNTTKSEIEEFLCDCKKRAKNSLEIVNTEKNRNTRTKLGLSKQNIKDIILGLTAENYSDGPLKDKSRSGAVWFFGVFIENQEIYIKMRLSKFNDPGNEIPTLVCLSFHFAERPQKYPYKKSEKKSTKKKIPSHVV